MPEIQMPTMKNGRAHWKPIFDELFSSSSPNLPTTGGRVLRGLILPKEYSGDERLSTIKFCFQNWKRSSSGRHPLGLHFMRTQFDQRLVFIAKGPGFPKPYENSEVNMFAVIDREPTPAELRQKDETNAEAKLGAKREWARARAIDPRPRPDPRYADPLDDEGVDWSSPEALAQVPYISPEEQEEIDREIAEFAARPWVPMTPERKAEYEREREARRKQLAALEGLKGEAYKAKVAEMVAEMVFAQQNNLPYPLPSAEEI